VTETQNVAQVEQGKIQEELPKIQTELSTINADIEAQKEKLEAASIYSKAEVDSKVADLDSVKADKTFVDAQLAETESQLEFQANADIPIVIPTYDGNNQTTHPKVLYFETPWNGYKYWMAHTPYANSNDRLENPSLCVSNDGITWAEPNGLVNPLDKPIDTTISHMSDNDLLMRGNVMEIWYRETIRNGGGDIIYRKTSTNGLTWSDREIVFQTGAGGQILSPSTLYEDGKYKMWYVSNFEIHYMESTNGIEWTTPIEVTVNYEKVSENYMPWHLEVIKEDGKYGLVLNAQRSSVGEVNSRRAVFYGKSENKAEFNVEPIIHPRPRGTGTWDDRHIYKSSLVKVNDLYRLYYSAQSDQNQWAVGVSQGKDVFNLSGVNVLSANNDLTNINKIKPFGDYYVDGENGKVYYTGKNINSYLTNDELKFVNPNVAGARLIVEELPNTLEVRGDNRNTRGNFKARNILVDRIVPNATNGEIPVDGNFLIMGSQEERKGLKFVDLGNKAVRIGIGSMNNTAKVYRDGATQYGGFLELAGLIVEGGTTVPEIEGAIRYNDTLKKHQGFDGTTWNNLY
ncbi:hypothetical protein B5H05_15725, partial [Listeria monocytogenes]|nr:hypothetical protein [Listeria monocytogenes]